MNPELREYAENDWRCRTISKDLPCNAVKTCIEMYPNLKCHKNER